MEECDLFEYNEEDEHPLPEFFDKFKDKLPMLVIVVGGDYGLTKWDDLSNDTVLRYHQYYGLKRVVARPSEEAKRDRLEYLSIPVLAPYRYQIVKSKQQADGPEKTMEEILKNHPLPVLVRFCPWKAPEIIDTTKNPTFLLTKIYEEYYLQGNCFINGELQTASIATFLSPRITVTEILGLKDNTKEEFEKYKKRLDDYVGKRVKFSPQDCNLAVKKFHFGDEGFENVIEATEIIQSPKDEPTPAPPPRRGHPPIPQDSQDPGLYHEAEDDNEEDDDDNYEVVHDDMIAKKLPPKPKAPRKKEGQEVRPELPPRPADDEKIQHLKKNPVAMDGSNSKENPYLTPRKIDEKGKHKIKPVKAGSTDKDTALNTGKTNPSKDLPVGDDTGKKAEYENDIVCPVSPFSETKTEKEGKKTVGQVQKEKEYAVVQKDTPPGKVDTPKYPREYMSIQEVGELLKKLNLSKYVEQFEKESVDSEILKDLEAEILKNEFNFSKLETMRLMKYINTGHIPR